MISATEIVVAVDGTMITGWESLTVSASMDDVTRSFSMEIFDADGTVSAAIPRGAEVTIFAAESNKTLWKKFPLIVGYVDSRARSLSGDADTFTISGRGKTCDLVDCSAEWPSATWLDKKFSGIVSDLVSPYPVKVNISALTGDPKLPKFTLQNGETVFAAVERLCKYQGVLPLEDANGDLVLTYAAPAGSATAQPLTAGGNIERISWTTDDKDRFASYTGKAQSGASGRPWTEKNLHLVSEAWDAAITRTRPLVFIAESKEDKAILDRRVAWEAQIRAGRSESVSITVPDFFQFDATGSIIDTWRVNQRVVVTVERWKLKREFLISGVSFSISEDGRSTELTLVHPDTYTADPTADVRLS